VTTAHRGTIFGDEETALMAAVFFGEISVADRCEVCPHVHLRAPRPHEYYEAERRLHEVREQMLRDLDIED
jgi:hypothetical protein